MVGWQHAKGRSVLATFSCKLRRTRAINAFGAQRGHTPEKTGTVHRHLTLPCQPAQALHRPRRRYFLSAKTKHAQRAEGIQGAYLGLSQPVRRQDVAPCNDVKRRTKERFRHDPTGSVMSGYQGEVQRFATLEACNIVLSKRSTNCAPESGCLLVQSVGQPWHYRFRQRSHLL